VLGDPCGRLRPAAPARHVPRGGRAVRPCCAARRAPYTYDFGDSWEHDVLVEDILAPDGVAHAVCLAGRRAGPPEDCGGVWGYAELCDILADPDHPDHAERVDPAAFDEDAVNASLARIRLG
jgi:hypothetical protein